MVRERPAFRSPLAKHPLYAGGGVVRSRPRHKALLGKPGGDGAKRAAVIQLGRRLDHFRAQLGNALAALALAAAVKRGAFSLGALALTGAAKLGHKPRLLKLGKRAGNLAHRLFHRVACVCQFIAAGGNDADAKLDQAEDAKLLCHEVASEAAEHPR